MPAIELEGVTKSFGSTVAVNGLDLSVPEASIYGFIGPNGSGKTTTLRLILRIFQPDVGRVVVLGADHGAVADDRLGYLPEERGLYRRMRVLDVIDYFARLKNCRDGRAHGMTWLERLGAGDWANKRLDALSKGMAQKVQFIVSVIGRPTLVILDEPFSGLDPVNLDLLQNAVLKLREEGATVVLSTHDMNVAERLCDAIFMIHRGHKVLDGTLAEIQRRYPVKSVRYRLAGDAAPPGSLPGVAASSYTRPFHLATLADGVAPQELLRALAATDTVEHFEVVRPTLHDIFVAIAGSGAEERNEMGKIFTIARREYSAMVATKAFLLSITLMPILMFGGVLVAGALANRTGDVSDRRIVIADGTHGELFGDLDRAAKARNDAVNAAAEGDAGEDAEARQPKYVLERHARDALTDEDRLSLSDEVRGGKAKAFVEIPAAVLGDAPEGNGASAQAEAAVQFYGTAAQLSDERRWIESAVNDAVRSRRFKSLDLDPAIVARATAEVPLTTRGLVKQLSGGRIGGGEKGQEMTSIFLPFAFMMLMFMIIMLSAQPLMESAIEEKSGRIAEVLLGSVNTFQLMLGKLLGNVAGSLTAVSIYLAGGLAMAMYKGWTDFVPWHLMPWFVVFQVLAVLLYSSIFLAVGASITQLKEAQSMLLPIWLVMCIPMFTWLQMVREPNGALATGLSFFPPSAPLVMVLRLASEETVPFWQVASALIVLLAATIAVTFLAARIFRIGMLWQGKTPKLTELVRWAWSG